VRRLVWKGEISAKSVAAALPRARQSDPIIEQKVRELLADVQLNGTAALVKQAKEFDGIQPQSIRVPHSALDEALAEFDPQLKAAIQESIRRVRLVSQKQLPATISSDVTKGGSVELRFKPVDSVGVYVPGGKAVYPSSTIMNVVPAQVAGVKRIALASPAQKTNNGLPDATVLATAALLGVTEVYSIGGAGAVAAFAYGVDDLGLEPVQMITGPGNIYVATAKQLLKSVVAIDSEAGPTEIMVIADEAANPAWIAADLISQAEHDENAASVLLATSSKLIDEVEQALESQLRGAANKDRVAAALAGLQSALVHVDDLAVAVAVANEYAAEHLSIQTQNAKELSSSISNAGAIFIGSYAPVSLGDYLAGSNHVLPTGAQAKRSAGLGVFSFLRPQQVVEFDAPALAEVTEMLEIFSNSEGLPGHGEAARIRFKP
jgi:histidinol dehydrogenase